MRQSNSRATELTRSAEFSLGVAVASAASVVGSALNIAAGSPFPPLMAPVVTCGVFWVVMLAKWTRATRRSEAARFVGTGLGVALSVATAMISQSNDLTPRMGLPVPFAELSATSAEILYGKPQPVKPILVQPRPRSFLSHTHEQTVWQAPR